MSTTRQQMIQLIEQDCIPYEKIEQALSLSKLRPDGRAWRSFVDQLLLWLGVLALVISVIFFIAYNWEDLGRYAKFALVELLLALAILGYWRLDEQHVGSKITLLAASLLLGALLALYGQTYQTGADTYELFFTWALYILPWTIIGRFPALWILWIALVNLAIGLYFTTFRQTLVIFFSFETGMLWTLFVFNTLALVTWESLSIRWTWLAERWAPRLLALGGGSIITWLTLVSILDDRLLAWPSAVWAVWLIGMYSIYRIYRQDLFMLAGAALSAIIIVIGTILETLLHDLDAGGLLMIALIIIGMGAGAAVWLRKIHEEFQA